MKTKYGFSVSTLQNPFFSDLVKGMHKVLPSSMELVVKDASENAYKQLEDIDELMALEVKVMLINPVDINLITPAINKLNKLNIPVIALARKPISGRLESFIDMDDIKGSKQAGEYIAEHVEPNSKIAMLRGPRYLDCSKQRETGFLKGVKSKGSYTTVLSENSRFYSRDEGHRLMSKLLDEHKDLKGVFSCNDEMALGAIKAIKERGKKIVIVGFDGIEEALKAIENGELDATIKTYPETMGAVAFATALKLSSNKKVDKLILTPTGLYEKG